MLVFNKAFQHIADLYRPYPCRCAGENVIPLLQGEITRQVYNECFKGKNQVARMAVLNYLPVFFELEMNVFGIG